MEVGKHVGTLNYEFNFKVKLRDCESRLKFILRLDRIKWNYFYSVLGTGFPGKPNIAPIGESKYILRCKGRRGPGGLV